MAGLSTGETSPRHHKHETKLNERSKERGQFRGPDNILVLHPFFYTSTPLEPRPCCISCRQNSYFILIRLPIFQKQHLWPFSRSIEKPTCNWSSSNSKLYGDEVRSVA